MAKSQTGNTLAEYAMISGLVVILAIGGMRVFGSDVKTGLYDKGNSTLATDKLQDYVSLNFKSASGTPGSGGLAIGGGIPTVPIGDTVSSGWTNATSLENQTGVISQKLLEISKTSTDPKIAALASKLAKDLAGLALAESTYGGKNSTFKMADGQTYTQSTAIKDIIQSQTVIRADLASISGANSAALDTIHSLVAQAQGLAQPTINRFNEMHYIADGDSATVNPSDIEQGRSKISGSIFDSAVADKSLATVGSLLQGGILVNGQVVQTTGENALAVNDLTP